LPRQLPLARPFHCGAAINTAHFGAYGLCGAQNPVNNGPPRSYRSSGQRGFSQQLQSLPGLTFAR